MHMQPTVYSLLYMANHNNAQHNIINAVHKIYDMPLYQRKIRRLGQNYAITMHPTNYNLSGHHITEEPALINTLDIIKSTLVMHT